MLKENFYLFSIYMFFGVLFVYATNIPPIITLRYTNINKLLKNQQCNTFKEINNVCAKK